MKTTLFVFLLEHRPASTLKGIIFYGKGTHKLLACFPVACCRLSKKITMPVVKPKIKPISTSENSKQTQLRRNVVKRIRHNSKIRTERTVAKSKPKYKLAEHFPDLKADKPSNNVVELVNGGSVINEAYPAPSCFFLLL